MGDSMITKEIPIIFNGKEEVVVIKKLSWGERNAVLRDTIGKIKVYGGDMPTVEIDPVAWRESVMLKAIVKAPFPVDRKMFDEVDADILDKIFEAVSELNPFRDVFKA